MKENGIITKLLHMDRWKGVEHGSLHKPIHTSVAYDYAEAEDLAAAYQGRLKGYAYGRQANPTITALEEKVTLLEQGVGTICFGSGMAAINGVLLSMLKQGDHIIASDFLFGNTVSLLKTLERFGIAISFVDVTNVEHVRSALRPETRLVFVETIANPGTQIADLEGIGACCFEKGILYIVDNTMTSGAMFLPKNVNAGLIINSLTKVIGGHGNALGGSVTDTGYFDWRDFPNILECYKKGVPQSWALEQIRKKGLRDGGGALAPEAAHLLAVGAETLNLRTTKACHNAANLCSFLENQAQVKRVDYPGLPSHGQHERALKLFQGYGRLFSFVLHDGYDCFAFLNHSKLLVNSSNLGDNRTLAIPVAHTIFFELGTDKRKEMGIDENMIRVSVGIEESDDLIDDFKQALEQLKGV